MKGFYRIKQVEAKLGITAKTIRKLISLGKLPEFERPYPLNSRYTGYSEGTMKRVELSINSRMSST